MTMVERFTTASFRDYTLHEAPFIAANPDLAPTFSARISGDMGITDCPLSAVIDISLIIEASRPGFPEQRSTAGRIDLRLVNLGHPAGPIDVLDNPDLLPFLHLLSANCTAGKGGAVVDAQIRHAFPSIHPYEGHLDFGPTIVVIERVMILPEFRGTGLAADSLMFALCHHGANAQLVVADVIPVQFWQGGYLSDMADWVDSMTPRAFCDDQAVATQKLYSWLQNFHPTLDFQRIPDTSVVFAPLT